MTKTEQVHAAMVQAMKDRDAKRKDAFSLLLSALRGKAKDKREPLTEAEEDEIIKKEIRQLKETKDSAPKDRTDIIEECDFRLAALSPFAPAEMGEGDIQALIEKTMAELGISAAEPGKKGLLMKTLMPLVKGKADGGVVNRLTAQIFEG